MPIYTRKGDGGETSLFGGTRVPKCDPRLAACGALDEFNAALGILRLHLSEQSQALESLRRVQSDLFTLGAQLAAPPEARPQLEAKLKQPLWPLEKIEAEIDRLMQTAPPLAVFILPGGCPGAAWAHWVRTLCRRAEREVVALALHEPIAPGLLAYLNRLSDWLFALARAENALNGTAEVQWKP
jgi:cob(I)alamin adenosyltransferase